MGVTRRGPDSQNPCIGEWNGSCTLLYHQNTTKMNVHMQVREEGIMRFIDMGQKLM